ncbi:MAG: antibiotic biosynthesis monooxygenase [Burkholderiales bacterium]|jgi:quinol monooxygenase YgiN|nr:antibiotic biosynthesis monooxygenase [Burkholderiales bacterium]
MCYVVAVEFEIDPQHIAEFLLLICENARISREREPGCRQFDVCTDPARPAVVFLYERYHDREAFESHLASEHFGRFDKATRGMVSAKRVYALQRIDPAA